jgi:hypothetical protein
MEYHFLPPFLNLFDPPMLGSKLPASAALSLILSQRRIGLGTGLVA